MGLRCVLPRGVTGVFGVNWFTLKREGGGVKIV